jgi:ankyrin repeat protein
MAQGGLRNTKEREEWEAVWAATSVTQKQEVCSRVQWRSAIPLYAAAEKGDNVIIRMLLDGGADIDAQGGTYGNALQAATARGHFEVVTLLQKQGASRVFE